MDLCVDGHNREFSQPLNVEQLLEHLELKPERVVVELNREILTIDRHADIQLQDGDTLELIQFVGGG